LLALDPSRARHELGWDNGLPYPASLQWTIEWQRRVDAGEDVRDVTIDQIDSFAALTAR
jgi:hypothetical protein